MTLSCPQCSSEAIRKNGSIHNGKQKYECIVCQRQFVENPTNKIISEDTKERPQGQRCANDLPFLRRF